MCLFSFSYFRCVLWVLISPNLPSSLCDLQISAANFLIVINCLFVVSLELPHSSHALPMLFKSFIGRKSLILLPLFLSIIRFFLSFFLLIILSFLSFFLPFNYSLLPFFLSFPSLLLLFSAFPSSHVFHILFYFLSFFLYHILFILFLSCFFLSFF